MTGHHQGLVAFEIGVHLFPCFGRANIRPYCFYPEILGTSANRFENSVVGHCMGLVLLEIGVHLSVWL